MLAGRCCGRYRGRLLIRDATGSEVRGATRGWADHQVHTGTCQAFLSNGLLILLIAGVESGGSAGSPLRQYC